MGYESVVVSKADLKWGLTKDGCCPENKYIHGKTGFKKKKKIEALSQRAIGYSILQPLNDLARRSCFLFAAGFLSILPI